MYQLYKNLILGDSIFWVLRDDLLIDSYLSTVSRENLAKSVQFYSCSWKIDRYIYIHLPARQLVQLLHPMTLYNCTLFAKFSIPTVYLRKSTYSKQEGK